MIKQLMRGGCMDQLIMACIHVSVCKAAVFTNQGWENDKINAINKWIPLKTDGMYCW